MSEQFKSDMVDQEANNRSNEDNSHIFNSTIGNLM